MKVSVIIPTHNRLETLKRAIRSYYTQSYQNKELIILADGCTDGTNEYLVETVFKGDVRVIIRHDANTSTGHNLLWNEAKGDLICQIHDDDFMTRNSIQSRVEAFQSGIDVVWGGVYHVDIAGHLIRIVPSSKQTVHEALSTGSTINFTAMMWRNSIRSKFMFDEDFKYQLDDMFKIHCLMECGCVAIPDIVMNYTIHEGQETVRGRRNGEIAAEIELMKEKIKNLYNL